MREGTYRASQGRDAVSRQHSRGCNEPIPVGAQRRAAGPGLPAPGVARAAN
jgi:hypothetical protein